MKMPKVMMQAFQIGVEVIAPAYDEFVGQTTDAAIAGTAKCLADIQSRIDKMDDDELLKEMLRATVQLACGAIDIATKRVVAKASDEDDDTPTGAPN